jgi:alanyl-tRNA synthetase
VNSDDIRTAFLNFFEEKGHTVIPSSSLVPVGDPTLLLTTAGMVQIKPYFLGEAIPPNRRLASCQKCFRTTDIESVGDATHLTFFEMLGNFSVGDYFKKEAIEWAWEFFTERLKISPEKLWATIYLDDDDSFRYWRETGVPEEKIVRFGEKDNFWGPAGSSGPCGPCSEIHYDFGADKGCGKADCKPNCDCGRFVEIWNLVFTQYNQDEAGNRTPLPRPNIDTGMGLERITTVMAGRDSVYQTDLFAPLLERVSHLTGRKYGAATEDDHAMRVVAEHGRAIAFLIADGVIPGNEGRGYVLRRLLRRAALFGQRLGLDKPFLSEVAETTVKKMGHVYPELKQRRDFILKAVQQEETRFGETLRAGLEIIGDMMSSGTAVGIKTVSGEDAFRLYDTYGFPVELTREIVTRAGYTVDMDGFEREMEKQRARARAAQKFDIEVKDGVKLGDIAGTEFVGYHTLEQKTVLVKLLVGGKEVEKIEAGQEASVILDRSPFYGEMGGQVGDAGEIIGRAGRFSVTDTIRVPPDIIVHKGRLIEGALAPGEEVRAAVDVARRHDIARNHTATHLLQSALRQVLGGHIQQRGSLVAPDRLRFDFSHLAAMTPDELLAVQRLVNDKVRQNLRVYDEETGYKQAVAAGAIALFDEKYGDVVRVMRIGDPPVSTELCGGTHVDATGEIGYFHILSQGSIGAGLRRIEAVTGRQAEALITQRLTALEKAARALEVAPEDVPEKVDFLLADLEHKDKRIQGQEVQSALREAESLIGKVEQVGGVNVLAARVNVPVGSQKVLREMADYIRDKLGSAVIVLGAVSGGQPVFIAAVTPDLVEKGYHAGNIIKQVSQVTGGGGGGKAGFAQAGGKDTAKIDEALRLVKTLVEGR